MAKFAKTRKANTVVRKVHQELPGFAEVDKVEVYRNVDVDRKRER